MNKFTTLTLTALTACMTIAPSALAKSNYSHHIQLGHTIRSTGINFKINPSECWEKEAFGWYWAYGNQMVICQENKRVINEEVNWTEEDLDTLRHEAQHLVQDCMDGERQGELGAVYRDPIDLAKKVLGDRGVRSIIDAYSDASKHVVVMELEAFSVARLNNPIEQVQDIQRYCF